MLNTETESQYAINYLHVFTKRKLLILIVTIATTAAAVWFESKRAPVHTATATLIVDFQDPINTSNIRTMLPALLQEDYMATQIGIISSKYMADKVFTALDFRGDSELQPVYRKYLEYSTTEATIRTNLGRWMLNNLRVYVHNKSTRLIKVSFKHTNPNVSIKIANAFAEQYLETVLELNQAPIRSSAEWITKMANPISVTLEQAEAKLDTRPSQRTIEEINSLLGRAQSDLSILGSMLNQGGVDGSYRRDDQYLLKISSDILQNEQLLIEKSREHGTRHPEYLSVVEKLSLLNRRFLSEVRQQIGSMKITLASLNKSLSLRGSVSLTNVTLLNRANVDIESDETGEKKALIYGAILGFLLGTMLAFLSIYFKKEARFTLEEARTIMELDDDYKDL